MIITAEKLPVSTILSLCVFGGNLLHHRNGDSIIESSFLHWVVDNGMNGRLYAITGISRVFTRCLITCVLVTCVCEVWVCVYDTIYSRYNLCVDFNEYTL